MNNRPVARQQPLITNAAQMKKQPAVYRPNPVPVVQLKAANGAENRKLPIAPPVYRPQPVPKVLQTKSALMQRPPAQPSLRRPVAPPVYRPEPRKIVQPKVFSQQRTPAAAPPVYRPPQRRIAQPKIAPAPQAQWAPKAPTAYRAQAKPVNPAVAVRMGTGGGAVTQLRSTKTQPLRDTTRYPAALSSSTIQREIGAGGPSNIKRMVVGRDTTIARIVSAERASYMAGAKPPGEPPWLYKIRFFNGTNGGFVIESDPNWWLVPQADEGQYMGQAKTKGWLIPLRSPVLQAPETGVEYQIKDGKLYSKQGGLLNIADKVSFVITAEGRLLMGFLHTGLSKAASTIMAGELTIHNGVAEYDWRRTGHYLTTQAEQTRGLEYMKKHYPWIVINQERLDEQERPKSLFELFADVQPAPHVSFESKPVRKPREQPPASVPSVSSGPSKSLSSGPSLPKMSFGPSLPSLSSGPSLAGPILDLSGVDLPDFSRVSGPSSKPSLSSPPSLLLDLSGVDLPDFSRVSSPSSKPSRSSGPSSASAPSLDLSSLPLPDLSSMDLSGLNLPDFSRVSSPGSGPSHEKSKPKPRQKSPRSVPKPDVPASVPRVEIPGSRAVFGTRADLPQPPPGAIWDSTTGQWKPWRWA